MKRISMWRRRWALVAVTVAAAVVSAVAMVPNGAAKQKRNVTVDFVLLSMRSRGCRQLRRG